jgi:DNA-binding transcriptional ArsR family regulator
MPVDLDVIQGADRLRGGLSPFRRAVLDQLRTPSSATTVAARLGESRQRVAYHVRELEKAGLLEVVEKRARRGCTERIVRLTANAVVVSPEVVGDLATVSQDRFAADTLLAMSFRTVTDVAQMRTRAHAEGRRLVTFAIEADIGFDRPADIERFVSQLTSQVTDLVAEYESGRTDHRYRLIVGGHPQRRRTPPPEGVQ